MKAILGVVVMTILATSIFLLEDSHHQTRHEATAALGSPVATTAVQPRPVPHTTRPPARQPPVRAGIRQGLIVRRVTGAIHGAVPKAIVGLEVVDRRTGLRFGSGEDTQFFSASLVKLLIAMDALTTTGTSDDAYDQQIRYMLSYSDDGTANRLWVADGGPRIVTRMAARIGLHDTVPPAEPGKWGATLVTAADIARIYEYLLTELPARPRQIIISALRQARPNGSDGFYQYFGIPDGLPGTPRAVKQGWMSYGARLELHTSGLVGAGDRYIVVLLTTAPAGTPEALARNAVTTGIRALAPAIT